MNFRDLQAIGSQAAGDRNSITFDILETCIITLD